MTGKTKHRLEAIAYVAVCVKKSEIYLSRFAVGRKNLSKRNLKVMANNIKLFCLAVDENISVCDTA
jgi:hypothetical protein